MIRPSLAAAVLAAVLLALVPAAPLPAADPFEIDTILSLSGPFAFLGNAEAAAVRALEVVVNRDGGINGRPVHFAIQDGQSQPAIAVQLANAIIAKKPPVLLGPANLASCLAVSPLVRTNGPLTYCFAPTIHPAPGSMVFSVGASSRDQYVAMMTFAAAKRLRRIAFIGTTDATGQDNETQVLDVLRSGRFPTIELVAQEHFAGSDVSIAAQAAKIKAANPDAVLAGTVGTPFGTVLRGLKDAGIDVPVLTNPGNLSHAQLEQYASFLPSAIDFVVSRFVARDVSGKGPVRDAQLTFYRALGAQGIDPDAGHNLPWDAALILVDALRHVGTNASPKQVLDELEATHGFAGTDGIYDFRAGDQRGLGVTSLVVATWNPTKKSWVTVSHPGGAPL